MLAGFANFLQAHPFGVSRYPRARRYAAAMANAASELATVLKLWRVKEQGKTVYAARGGTPSDREFWQMQVDAAVSLDRVRGILDALQAAGEDVNDYLEAFPVWARVLFAPDLQWSSPNAGAELASSSQVGLLTSLGQVVERELPPVPVNAQSKETIRNALNDIVELLAEDGCPLNVPQKGYVLRLINAIQRLLDDVEVQGSADLASNLNELYGYLTVLVKVTETEKPGFSRKLRNAAERVTPVLYAGAMLGMGILGAAADIKALQGP